MEGKTVHVAGTVNELAVQWVKYQPSWLVRAVGGVLARNRDAERKIQTASEFETMLKTRSTPSQRSLLKCLL